MEIWKDIAGYEGLYQVSNEGRVKSLEKNRHLGNGAKWIQAEKILKPRKNTKGYLQVALWKNRNYKNLNVHRLVAEAFISNPNNYPQVNHRDENKENNAVWVNEDGSIDQEKSNLEWCTNEYNHNYGTRNERGCKGLKEHNIKKRKKVCQYTIDGLLVKVWSSTCECGRNGFCQSGVNSCCNGKHKTHKGYMWKYLS